MRGAIAVAAAALALVGSAVHAQALPADLDALSRRLALQADEIGALRRMLAAQEAALAESQRALQGLVIERQAARPAPVPVPATSPAAEPAPAAVAAVASKADRSDRSAEAAAEAATQAAARVAPVADQPGVLTPKGYVTAEASLQFAYSSSNRIALAGYTVVPAILVGLVDVREVKRSTYTAALATRWGAWDRVELEAKLPYVWRSDTSIGREVNQASTADTAAFGASGHGIGDAEVTARYQLNALRADEPVVVASLRAKTRTGRDPFEVTTSRNVVGFRNDGIQQQLPTGSGFNGLQPGLTVLLPSDPAVFLRRRQLPAQPGAAQRGSQHRHRARGVGNHRARRHRRLQFRHGAGAERALVVQRGLRPRIDRPDAGQRPGRRRLGAAATGHAAARVFAPDGVGAVGQPVAGCGADAGHAGFDVDVAGADGGELKLSACLAAAKPPMTSRCSAMLSSCCSP